MMALHTLLGLSQPLPSDRPVSLLIRHAARPPIPPGEVGNELSLTPEGRQAAHHLGTVMCSRLVALHTSPVRRCVQTCEEVHAGAGVDLPIEQDTLLGEPGPYVTEPQLAWQSFVGMGHAEVCRALIEGPEPIPGMEDPQGASRRLVQHLLPVKGAAPGLSVFLSHDLIIGVCVAHHFGWLRAQTPWPVYLQALALWRDGDEVAMAYGAHRIRIPKIVTQDLNRLPVEKR